MLSSKGKQKRGVISLETKIIIVDRITKGEKFTAVAKFFNLGESTMQAILKNKNSTKC